MIYDWIVYPIFFFAVEIELYGSNKHPVFVVYLDIAAIKKCRCELFKDALKFCFIRNSVSFFFELF